MEASFSLFFVFIILSLLAVTKSDNPVFDVLHYGAIGDGQIDDTNAFLEAWKATCASDSSSSTVHVPSYKTFLIQPLIFNGPCNSKSVIVQIDGNLVAPIEPSKWKCEYDNCHRWIYFHKVDGLKVRGRGTIDGHGKNWWNIDGKERPTVLEISNANNVFLGGGLNFKDGPRMHVVLNSLRSFTVSNIKINAPEKSPNTDGIHVMGCTDSSIDHCQIGTGDDCISIGDGTSNLKVSNVICGPGHGISIGSLGKDGANDEVEYVTVSDSVLIGASNGVRIKTWQGGKGYARNFVFERILFHETSNPIIIDQYYCDHEECTTSESAVQISNVTYSKMLGTSRRKIAVTLKCSESQPCKDIVIEDMAIFSRGENEAQYECSNVYGKARGQIVPRISCLN
ncbi:hypothetical protein ACJIZ3_003391 [Penstemon smallii]|uniref:Polygalacturonase n=1 Tax=Penstemon smallii TaxID=265156 RepID=A0ABD3UCW9_9LAMI